MTTEATPATEVAFPDNAPKGAGAILVAIWDEGRKAFDSLAEAVKAATAVKGSMGEFVGQAKTMTNETLVADLLALAEDDTMTVGEFVAGVEQYRAEVLAKLTGDLAPKREAAEATYKSARADWDSFVNFAAKDKAGAKVLETLTIPTLPTAKVSKGSGSAKVSNAHLVFFSVDNGEEKAMAPTQNKLSSLAWYKAAELVADGKNGNVESLKAFAKEQNVDIDSTDWTLTLPSGRILGCRKVDEAEVTEA